MPDTLEIQAFDALAKHAHLADLVALVRLLATSATETRTADWKAPNVVRNVIEERQLGDGDGATDMGDALRVLELGPKTPEERALARALWAHAVAETHPQSTDEEDHLAETALWLAAHTPFDATMLFDRALGEDAEGLWTAVAACVRHITLGMSDGEAEHDSAREKGGLPTPRLGRAEALLGAAALATSSSATAVKEAALLASEVKDLALLRILRREPRERDSELDGEVLIGPRALFATTVLALTGFLLVMHLVRLVGRAALGYRKPARVTISEQGVRVRWRTEILGRTIRDRDVLFGREGLASVVREVRYPRIAFYAGLFFLAIGSFVGVRTLADGVRSASPTLLLTGFAFVALGILFDVALGSLVPGVSGRCRLVFVPRAGAPICVGGVDAGQADVALTRLAAAGA
jgi:hypothetical protein